MRKDRWASFRGLAWWEIVLSVLPLGLIAVGGLIGGLFGGVGLVINLGLARRRLGIGLEVAAMLGVAIAAYVLYFVVAGTILALTR
ncbi:MAG TPA: hypothetical protein VOB72_06725 [Candidatus Dormibacteraeota bacterium]|nr:hypothetical protein [Candidatus Dormibacteraeota bacterium]